MVRALSGEQVARYHEDGFLCPVPALSPVEARDCRARLEAFEAVSGTAARPAPRTAPRQDASALPLARRPRPPPGGAGRRRGPDRPGPARLSPHDVDQGAGRRRVRLMAPGRNVLRPRSRGPARHRVGRADGQPAGDGLRHGAAGQSSAGPAPAHDAARRRQSPVQRPAGGAGRGRDPRGAARGARGRVLAAPHAPPAQLGAEPRARPPHRRSASATSRPECATSGPVA